MSAAPATSVDNHTLLIQLKDAMTTIGAQLGSHITEQQAENKAIHQRITDSERAQREAENRFSAALDSLKDLLGKKGQLSGSGVLSLIAVAFTMIVGVGGIVTKYIDVRLGNVEPLIKHNTYAALASSAERDVMREQLVTVRVEQARIDAKSLETRRWLEKEQDEMKRKEK